MQENGMVWEKILYGNAKRGFAYIHTSFAAHVKDILKIKIITGNHPFQEFFQFFKKPFQ